MKVKKLLFASSFGMQALVYLSASNIEKVLFNLTNLRTLISSTVIMEEN